MNRISRSLCIVLLFFVLMPCQALARSYDVVAVDIVASVAADGTLAVVEQRTYSFDGSFGGIYWDIPRGLYEGRPIDAKVNWVGAISDAGQELYSEDAGGAPGTYEVSEGQDYLQLTLYRPSQDETVTFQVSYQLSRLATRWEDCGELYWQYVVPDTSSGSEWKNVTTTVRLPVPDGEVVAAGKNVRAWGHGPIDGAVAFEGDSVTYFSPGVGGDEFLEARVVFPAEWLSESPETDEAYLDSILAQEATWAKEANTKRRNARLIVYGIPASMVLMGVGSVLAMLWYARRVKNKMPKPQFTDEYFRDVPTNDHPAVLGMLYRQGKIDSKDFSSSLMRLADEGRITLDTVNVEKKTKRGGTKREREWRMLLHENAVGGPGGAGMRAGGREIDDAAFIFLKDVIASGHRHVMDPLLFGPGGEPYVIKAFFDEAAEKWPTLYTSGYDKWVDAVESAYKGRKFESELPGDDIIASILGLGSFALAVIMTLAGMFLGVPNLWLCLAFIVQFGAGIAIIFLDDDLPRKAFSQEAVDIIAKLDALKRWLTDFTRLEEAIPTDVVLWNRLLVMATVLGVADKVVKQLRVSAPDLVGNPAFSAMIWHPDEREDPLGSFARSLSSGISTSSGGLYHETSTYETASSHDSSSGGSGGGFSGGGGGGFSGGGGRGGAF